MIKDKLKLYTECLLICQVTEPAAANFSGRACKYLTYVVHDQRDEPVIVMPFPTFAAPCQQFRVSLWDSPTIILNNNKSSWFSCRPLSHCNGAFLNFFAEYRKDYRVLA